MGIRLGRAVLIVAGAAVALVCAEGVRSIAENGRMKKDAVQEAKKLLEKVSQGEAAKRNSLGVAYMGQQKFADAEKEFAAALAIDGTYSLAQLNLGISLMAQQKADAARAALVEATEKRPKDPYG